MDTWVYIWIGAAAGFLAAALVVVVYASTKHCITRKRNQNAEKTAQVDIELAASENGSTTGGSAASRQVR
jgi:hypothetical protein